ncbi:hypothetical protein PRZ48_006892 [Zasmidium cellare]|uniref:Uncharacterized protein n=1 Tax=Zasmidium cellare TaxID=395010 RepID=A0ABR0EIL4_ZASCE|nr:hypothetical protein PRZ48_006892 [Zasmidium cellare]
MAANDLAEMGASSQPAPPRRSLLGAIQRRRQRSPATDSRDGSDDPRSRRPKRRKLDSDPSSSARPPIKYGHWGQVEPGKLKLEIISCDGGEHRDPRHPNTYLGSQNVLRHDKSVYCSERQSSSIVLRHADDTPFCLEKLHVVGPEHGFTAPVREGLIYVAMSLNDLQKYMDPPPHARLHGIHTPPYRRRRSFRASPERITLSDALRDPEISAALDQRDRDYASRADAANDLSEEPYYGEDFGFGREDAEAHCEIPSTGDTADVVISPEDANLPVTLLSDEEPGPEESSSQEVLDFRLQRLRNMRRRLEADSWDREDWRTNSAGRYNDGNDTRDGSWNLRHLDAMMARSRMADSPQRDESPEERERNERYAYQNGSGPGSYYHATEVEGLEYYDDGLNDPNVTRARFHIREGKYKVAIKFDPPVSGRFILLKLWANRGNVDVQSVIAKGFGGSRFFPAVEYR